MPLHRKLPDLTPRRREILRRYVQGQSHSEIAEALGIAKTTVATALRVLRTIYRVRSVRDLVRLVHDSNLLEQ
jgi:DNA-binding CsgD family transcriptional regulator